MGRADGTYYYLQFVQRVETRCYNINRAFGSQRKTLNTDQVKQMKKSLQKFTEIK